MTGDTEQQPKYSWMVASRLGMFSVALLSAGCDTLNLGSLQSGPSAISGPARIIDGDTIEVGHERIRLHGIDAPEMAQICTLPGGGQQKSGEDARDALSGLVGGSVVECSWESRDDYDRPIAKCSVGEVDLSRRMVRDGWALAFVRYSEDYVVEEAEAKAVGIG